MLFGYLKYEFWEIKKLIIKQECYGCALFFFNTIIQKKSN